MFHLMIPQGFHYWGEPSSQVEALLGHISVDWQSAVLPPYPSFVFQGCQDFLQKPKESKSEQNWELNGSVFTSTRRDVLLKVKFFRLEWQASRDVSLVAVAWHEEARPSVKLRLPIYFECKLVELGVNAFPSPYFWYLLPSSQHRKSLPVCWWSLLLLQLQIPKPHSPKLKTCTTEIENWSNPW